MVLRPHSQLVRARGAALPTSNPDMRPSIRPLAVALAIFGLLSASLPLAAAPAAASVHDLILRVGEPDEMKTRNPLPSIANDAATRDVHGLVHDVPLRTSPEGTLVPYIAKGVDFDEDGTFEASEYGVFAERTGAATPLIVDVYYDFNGVQWHDGVQMTPWDLFFSYHVNAQNSRFSTDLRVLFPSPWSYEAGGRQLSIERFDVDTVTPGVQRNWEGEGTMFGGQNNPLRVAVRFTPMESFARFYESTLVPSMLPMHIWSRTGGGLHADFGCAIWIPQAEATARGILECGNSNDTTHGKGIASPETVTGSRPYRYSSAEGWAPTDNDVIGSGPFRFVRWAVGTDVLLVRNDDYYTGIDSRTKAVYDRRLAPLLALPAIEGIRFLVRGPQVAAFALRNGEIDIYRGFFPPEIASDLLRDPNVGLHATPEFGFSYLMYNMRNAPFGYENDNPTRDVGYWFRQAVSHLVDKETIVREALLGFGQPAQGVVSPASRSWYDRGIPRPRYDPNVAQAILDSPGARAEGYGPDPPGLCSRATPGGCRSLPAIGISPFEVHVFTVDYDRARFVAGDAIVRNMQTVGLNAVPVAKGPSPIVPCFNRCLEDLYILSWRIGSDDPDYLFSFFHSSNAPSGQNYPGFKNETFDALIEASRTEMDRTIRRSLISQCQRLLADARPYEPLFFRDQVEAYRRDRFSNWIDSGEGIWNYWSLLSIRPPTEPAMRVLVDAPLQLAAGSMSPIRIRVRDTEGLAVPDASLAVEVAATSGDPGTLVANGIAADSLSLVADAGGSASLLYRAPTDVASGPRQIRIQIAASHPDFPPVTWESALDVYSVIPGFLQVTVDYPAGDRARPGDAIPIRIEVVDDDGRPVPDAHIAIETSDQAGIRPAQPSGDLVTLRTTFLLADPGIAEATTFTVTVRASREGLGESVVTTRVTVVPEPRLKLCPGGNLVSADDPCPVVSSPTSASFVWAATGTVIAVATAVALAILRKPRR